MLSRANESMTRGRRFKTGVGATFFRNWSMVACLKNELYGDHFRMNVDPTPGFHGFSCHWILRILFCVGMRGKFVRTDFRFPVLLIAFRWNCVRSDHGSGARDHF